MLQAEAELEEVRAVNLALQAGETKKKSSLVFRLIRGGLSILAAALTLQQVRANSAASSLSQTRIHSGWTLLESCCSVRRAALQASAIIAS